eukprot:COSAG02_NODE_1477_length_12419_cov_15.891396_13_plen_207_part_00
MPTTRGSARSTCWHRSSNIYIDSEFRARHSMEHTACRRRLRGARHKSRMGSVWRRASVRKVIFSPIFCILSHFFIFPQNKVSPEHCPPRTAVSFPRIFRFAAERAKGSFKPQDVNTSFYAYALCQSVATIGDTNQSPFIFLPLKCPTLRPKLATQSISPLLFFAKESTPLHAVLDSRSGHYQGTVVVASQTRVLRFVATIPPPSRA